MVAMLSVLTCVDYDKGSLPTLLSSCPRGVAILTHNLTFKSSLWRLYGFTAVQLRWNMAVSNVPLSITDMFVIEDKENVFLINYKIVCD